MYTNVWSVMRSCVAETMLCIENLTKDLCELRRCYSKRESAGWMWSNVLASGGVGRHSLLGGEPSDEYVQSLKVCCWKISLCSFHWGTKLTCNLCGFGVAGFGTAVLVVFSQSKLQCILWPICPTTPYFHSP